MTERIRLTRKFVVPSWLSEGEGELLGYALDLVKDAFVQRVYLGLLARFPETAPDDALPIIGRMRRVIRGLGESRESYVERLIRWLDDRQTAGNPFALMQKLAEYTGPGCVFRTVDARGNWFTRNVDGTWSWVLNQQNWDWDSALDLAPNRWSRFWVIIYPPPSLWVRDTRTWGTAPNPAYSIGSTASREQVQTVRALVADWKPAGTRCVNIIVAFDPASFSPASPEPDGKWGHWCKDNGSGVAVSPRLETARYWDGVI